VSTPLQAIVFSSYLLNVLIQLANKNGIRSKKKLTQVDLLFSGYSVKLGV
jgi:hypothetical protein